VIRVEVAHRLEPAEVERRLRALAERHQIALRVVEPGRTGELAKPLPFLGNVEARYEIDPTSLAVEISRAPAVLSARLSGLVESELARALG
jgi:hypothetical protein